MRARSSKKNKTPPPTGGQLFPRRSATIRPDAYLPACSPHDVSLPACTSTGMNKMVINHLDKLFVTSDAAVIVRELEVAHPAAKLLVMAAQAQEQEIGDGTNLVVTFGGELLGNAEELIRDGLHPS